MCTNTNSNEEKYFYHRERYITFINKIYPLTDFISLNAKVKPRSGYRLELATIKSPFIRNSWMYRCKITLFVVSHRRLG